MVRYNVAFRYTKKTGGFHGNITWTTFANKEEFDKWYTPKICERQEIVEEGITEERAIELVQTVPFACRIAACVQGATTPDGEINQDILEAKMATTLFADQLSSKA